MKSAAIPTIFGALLAGAIMLPAQSSAQLFDRDDRRSYERLESDADRFGREQYERGYRQGLADSYRREGYAWGRFIGQEYGEFDDEREFEDRRYGYRGGFRGDYDDAFEWDD